jgi:hypothetical protein
MGSIRHWSLCFVVLGFALFSYVTHWRLVMSPTPAPLVEGRVVIAAPVLLVLFGGDRFLAANLEAMRLAATGVDGGLADTDYLVRAHKEVARLNPCHEDNYYLANALLTWGGAVYEGEAALLAAIDCRFWDEWPPFFYGFNRFFFSRDVPGAVPALEEAANRASDNAAGFRKLAVMIQAEQIADEQLALEFLSNELSRAREPKLKGMLAKRVKRLQGLVMLRDAQRRYEALTGKPLGDPGQLIEYGLLAAFPEDPLNLGYEFIDGRIVLKKLKVAGAEDR